MAAKPVRALSPQLLEALHSSGWALERSVETAKWASALELDGFVIVTPFHEAMSSLGGLTLECTRMLPSEPPEKISEYIHFDPVRTITEWPQAAWNIEDWSTRAGEPLTPVGFINDDSFVVLLGESSAAYLSWGNLLARVGIDVWDFLESRFHLAEQVAL